MEACPRPKLLYYKNADVDLDKTDVVDVRSDVTVKLFTMLLQYTLSKYRKILDRSKDVTVTAFLHGDAD